MTTKMTRKMWSTTPEPPAKEVWDARGDYWKWDGNYGVFQSEFASVSWDTLIEDYGPIYNYPPLMNYEVGIKVDGHTVQMVVAEDGKDILTGTLDQILKYMSDKKLSFVDDEAWFNVVFDQKEGN